MSLVFIYLVFQDQWVPLTRDYLGCPWYPGILSIPSVGPSLRTGMSLVSQSQGSRCTSIYMYSVAVSPMYLGMSVYILGQVVAVLDITAYLIQTQDETLGSVSYRILKIRCSEMDSGGFLAASRLLLQCMVWF